MKHPQHIVAFDKEGFGALRNGFNTLMIQEFLTRAQRSLIIGRRHELESDERYGQMLPYVVFYKDFGDGDIRYFAYQRGKGVGEARLAGNVSCGGGGHVDFGDIQQKESIIDVLGTINNAMIREIQEEFRFQKATENGETKPDLKPVFFGVINDLRDPVGAVHFGLLYGIKLPTDIEVWCREEELHTIGFLSRQQFSAVEPTIGSKLEGWTEIVLKQHLEFVELSKVI